MKLKTSVAVFALTALLSACGGGGGSPGTSAFGSGSGSSSGSGSGSSGSGSTATSAPTLSLVLKNGSSAATQATVGSQNYTLEVTLKDSTGAVVPSKLVTTTATDFTFITPTNGQALTGSSTGVATFTLRQTSSTASGGTQICAKATVETTALAGCLDVQMGAVAADLGTFSTVSSAVAAYQSIQLSIPATLSGLTTPAVGIPVAFTSTCGTLSPASVTTDSNGIAKVSYTNDNSGTTCSGSQSVTARTDTATRTVTFSTTSAAAANIQFVSASPARIYLKGSPGVSSSILKFKLLDQNANKMVGEKIAMDFVLRPAGASLRAAGTISVESTTDSNGEVAVTVLAGTAPGPVQVRATLTGTSTISNVSNGLSIASGLPAQNNFSLSVSTFNIEAWHEDGVETFLTVRASDRLGNPVPDGTAINFITEGGQVVASCLTSGASENKTSSCSVTLSSQNPRGGNGRLTVLAWAQGEESFVDQSSPSNNVYDSSTDTFVDLGQPFLDRDFDNARDSGEESVGVASGTAACTIGTNSEGHVVPSTCDGVWGSASVYATTEIVFSDDTPDLTKIDVTALAAPSANFCEVAFTLKDLNGNPLPAGTTLTTSDATGGTFVGFGGEGAKVPNTNRVSRTTHSAVFKTCPDVNSLSFTLKVKTPKGVETSILIAP